MSEQTTEPADQAEAEPDTPEQASDATPDAEGTEVDDPPTGDVEDGPLRKARRDAAGYRDRLRAAEQERDTASQAVERLQIQLIERELQGTGVKAEALWAAGFKPASLVGGDRGIAPELVAAAVETTRAKLGIPTPTRFQGSADAGPRGTSTPTKPSAGWGDLLDPKTNTQAQQR